MGFTRSKYEAGFGIVFVELSDEEAAVAGTEPTAAADANITAYASGSRRRNGVHTRGVLLSREITDPTGTATVTKFLTLRSAADEQAPAYQPNATVTIGGVDWTVSRFREETLV